MITSILLCLLFVLLVPIPWWAVLIVSRALHRHPEASMLREQGQRFTIAGIAGVMLAIIGINYLLGVIGWPQLPRGAGFVLLTVALLAIHAQPALFLFNHYRR